MNLVEALMGSMVFTLSSTCSLQIYSSSLRWTATAQKHQQLASAVDAELLAHPARAATAAAALLQGIASSDNCSTAADVLTESLGAYPTITPAGQGKLGRDYRRQGDLVLVVVAAADLPQPQRQRQRWLHPAVYGLCGGSWQPAAATADAGNNDAGALGGSAANGNDANHSTANDLGEDDALDSAQNDDGSAQEPGQP